MNKKGKEGGIGAILVIAGIVFAFMWANGHGWFKQGASTTPGGTTPTGQVTSGEQQCNVAPSYTYTARDPLNGVTLTSTTNQIKTNGYAPVSSGNPIAGKSLQYWVSNATYFCDVASDTGKCGTQVIQDNCYQNASTYTMTVYSEPAHTALTATTTTGVGATNVSIAASGLANLQLTTQGTAKRSAEHFGGCVAVEYPSTVTSLTLSGALSSSKSCPYKWTYSVASTSNTYQTFEMPAGFDSGAGDIKSSYIQVQNGATDITAGNLIVTLQPANYYVGNDGNFYLGIEKDKNADTTKTANAQQTAIAIS